MTKINSNPAKGKPLSSHPLFPAVIALWFGALFGLGSLAIRPSLIEELVLKSGLDLVIPAAAPPLGVTARILIALLMAAVGAAIGAVLAMRINRPQIVQRERKRGAVPKQTAEAEGHGSSIESPVCRPISAHEELGETLDSQGPLAGRRRPLAVNMEDQPFQPHEAAPLPGGEPPVFDLAATRPPLDDAGPLDLEAFAAPVFDAEVAPCEEPAAATEQVSLVDAQPSHPAQTSPQPDAPRIFGQAVSEGHLPADFVRTAGFRTSIFDTERPQPLFADRRAAIDPPAPADEIAQPDQTLPQQPESARPAVSDLAARLQESMARRRAAQTAPTVAPAADADVEANAATEPAAIEQQAEPAESAFVPPPRLSVFSDYREELPEPLGLGALQPAPAPPSSPALAPAPLPMPAALRPVGLELIDEDEPADIAGLVPRSLERPTSGEAEDAATAAEPDPVACPADLPPRQEFVRIDEPDDAAAPIEPVVIFPGQMASNGALRPFDAPATAAAAAPVAETQVAPAIDPEEAQIALRSALANLQRISGAA